MWIHLLICKYQIKKLQMQICFIWQSSMHIELLIWAVRNATNLCITIAIAMIFIRSTSSVPISTFIIRIPEDGNLFQFYTWNTYFIFNIYINLEMHHESLDVFHILVNFISLRIIHLLYEKHARFLYIRNVCS